MGEYADAILDGDMCELCGMYMEGGEGVARTCDGCSTSAYKKTYITFGSDHKHKIKGKHIDWHCIAVIICNDREHGRKLAFEFFSTKFCMEYHEDEFVMNDKYYPRGLINVN